VANKSSESSAPVREVEIRRSPIGTDYDLRQQIERALYAQLALVTGRLTPK
jgi:hypothetical protein